MISQRFALISIGLAVALMPSAARADIRVTLTSDNAGTTTTTSQTQSGNAFGALFDMAGSAFTVSSSITNYPGGTTNGQLTSNLTFLPTTLTNITVLVEDVYAQGTTINGVDVSGQREVFTSPTSSRGYVVSTLATENVGSDLLTGTAQVNGLNGLAPATVSTTGGSASNSATIPGNAAGFTLAETYKLSNVSSFSAVNVSFTSTVSPSTSPAAVPEPSALVLTGLTTLGAGVVGLGRRLRNRSV